MNGCSTGAVRGQVRVQRSAARLRAAGPRFPSEGVLRDADRVLRRAELRGRRRLADGALLDEDGPASKWVGRWVGWWVQEVLGVSVRENIRREYPSALDHVRAVAVVERCEPASELAPGNPLGTLLPEDLRAQRMDRRHLGVGTATGKICADIIWRDQSCVAGKIRQPGQRG